MPTYAETKTGYHNLWNKAAVRPEKAAAANKLAEKILSEPYQSTFKKVEDVTGVPWFLVAALLERESSLDLNTYLGNGEKLDQVTHLVPAGRGPFKNFQAGAVDALTYEGMTGIAPSDWTVERMLYWAERFNGEGYFGKNINSPYLWSWTNLYTSGKYVADGKFSSSEVDPQPGVAAILKALAEASPEIAKRLTTEAPVADQPATPAPAPTLPTAPIPPGPAFHLPHIPFAEMEQFVETLGKVIPWAQMIPVPQVQHFADMAVTFLPVIENVLKSLDHAEATIEKGGTLSTVFEQDLPAIWAQLKTIKLPAPVATTPPPPPTK